jgi:hypothetical protein
MAEMESEDEGPRNIRVQTLCILLVFREGTQNTINPNYNCDLGALSVHQTCGYNIQKVEKVAEDHEIRDFDNQRLKIAPSAASRCDLYFVNVGLLPEHRRPQDLKVNCFEALV